MSTPPNDHYTVLGLPRDASQAEIIAAFRNLLRCHHPDTRAAGNIDQDHHSDVTLQQILDAYATLREPARRAIYDEQTASRRQPTSRPRPVHVTTRRPPEEPPLRAGPVHWTPQP